VIRVFIVAASPLARSGLQSLLVDRAVEIVGSSPDIDSLEGLLADAAADVLVLDASSENSEAVLDFLARSDLASEVPVVVLAGNSPPSWPGEALRNGVRAVLPADVSRDQLSATLQAVITGLLVLHPADIDALLPAATPASQPLTDLPEPLTRREREVLQMLAAGLANKAIAARLNISDHTAKFHVASILGKLGATTRTEAVTLGIRRGLVLL
jgi:two-component system, NarL family, response regulator YdfI